MKCDICNKNVDKVIPFYYDFFSTEYKPEKWINICPECSKKFLQLSNSSNRNGLVEMENKITNKPRKR